MYVIPVYADNNPLREVELTYLAFYPEKIVQVYIGFKR